MRIFWKKISVMKKFWLWELGCGSSLPLQMPQNWSISSFRQNLKGRIAVTLIWEWRSVIFAYHRLFIFSWKLCVFVYRFIYLFCKNSSSHPHTVKHSVPLCEPVLLTRMQYIPHHHCSFPSLYCSHHRIVCFQPFAFHHLYLHPLTNATFIHNSDY